MIRLFALALALLIPTGLGLDALHAPRALAAQKALIYVVHSYEHNHVCGQPQADGVVASLAEAGLYPDKVRVQSYYMDTKKTHASPAAIDEQGRLALAEIARLRPDVVITLDDNAFRHVGLPLAGRPDVDVIFSGLNGQPEEYNKIKPFMTSRRHPGSNVTGVYEKLHLKRALSVLAKSVPHLKKVVGITDFSPTGNAITRQFEIESKSGLAAEWEVRRVHSFSEYKQLILALNQDPGVQGLYPVALTLPTEDGGRVTAPEIFRWTIRHSHLPEIALNYFFSSLGLFGGASVDFERMGMLAGSQAVSVLQGKKAGELPIIEAPDYAIVFNVARAEMLGIRIPDDILLAAHVVFKEIPLLP